MSSTISQNNLYLIIPAKVSRMADMLVDDRHIGIEDAICQIYQSAVYQQLEKENTKLWHEGPVALYQRLV